VLQERVHFASRTTEHIRGDVSIARLWLFFRLSELFNEIFAVNIYNIRMQVKNVIFVWFWVAALLTVICDGSHINLNVKSAMLSRVLKSEEGQNIKDEKRSRKHRSHDHVSLDLSGQFNCHVTGPTTSAIQPIEDETTPLFRVGHADGHGLIPPSLFLSVKYDFATVWYGATRLLTTFRWDLSSRRQRNGVKKINLVSPPTAIDIQTEKGLRSPNDYAAQVGFTWKQKEDILAPPLSITARVDTTKSGTFSISAPIHRRIMINTSLLAGNKHGRDFISSRVPSWSHEDNDSWVPDLSLSANGRLVSNSKIALNPSWTRGNRIGLRLAISRQAIDWGAVGLSSMDDENTLFRFELCGTDKMAESYSSVTFETALNNIPETARFTLCRDQVLRGTTIL